MKIQYASDLHLELSGNSRYMNETTFEVTGEVLVLPDLSGASSTGKRI